jgi:hypothetical protein
MTAKESIAASPDIGRTASQDAINIAGSNAVGFHVNRGRETMLDGRIVLAAAIVFAVLVGAWFFRFEPVGSGFTHRNRITGAACPYTKECWFSND